MVNEVFGNAIVLVIAVDDSQLGVVHGAKLAVIEAYVHRCISRLLSFSEKMLRLTESIVDFYASELSSLLSIHQ